MVAQHRGWSQLALAGRAEISQRHLSFLELGRASPSREMVLRLAEALDVPLRQHNALLLAAGFAPIWRESGLDAPELAQIAGAVDYMLAKQEPFPAVAVDRHWNLLKANAARFAWSSSWSVRWPRMRRSISPTPWSRRTCCGRSCSIGPRWCAISSAASRRTLPPTAPTRPARSWNKERTKYIERIASSAVFVLAARADVPSEELRRSFPSQLKVGPVERIADLVRLGLPGVPVLPLPVAPRQIPFHAGSAYFELDQSSELWEQLKTSGGVALHVAGSFPGLAMEFWAIRT